MEKKTYKCTDLAGDWVAGMRKPADGKLQLTDEQAAHELRVGSIELVVETKPVPKKEKN